jgi:hypothetical protein
MEEGHDIFSESKYREYLVVCQSKRNTVMYCVLTLLSHKTVTIEQIKNSKNTMDTGYKNF